MSALAFEERHARALGAIVGALMGEGRSYDEAVVEAAASITPAEIDELRAARSRRKIERALDEIAREDLAPLLPLAYDDYLSAAERLADGCDGSIQRLVYLARFEDEHDDGQPFVVRDGIVERRAS